MPTSAQAHLLHVFPSFEAAGAQARTAALMGGFGDRYRHTLVALDGVWDALAWVPDEIELVRADVPPRRGPLATARGLARLLRERRPDLLCTYNWGSFDAVLAARMTGQRAHVHHEDGFHAAEAERPIERRVWARRLGLRRASAVAVPSSKLASMASVLWRLPDERIHWIPNGVDTERFHPAQKAALRGASDGLAAELGLPPEARVIGAVGRLNPVKRFDRLIRACARLQPGEAPVHLVIAGVGDELPALQSLAAQHRPPGGAVHFLGYRSDLPVLYAAMDAFVISSDSEQQPVSQLEAMAAGVPLVATAVGDVPGTLPEAARELVVELSAADVEGQLAAGLDRLLANADLCADLSARGRARVEERYSRAAMLGAYGQLYADALA